MDLLELIALREAAELCVVDARTLRRWVGEDRMRIYRRERKACVHWKDLVKCLVRRRLPVPPELEIGPKMLLVDDEPDQLLLMVDSLETYGTRTRIATARDGKSARDKLLRLRPDLLVLDLGLPDASGVDLCRWARGERELSSLKVLAITGDHEPAKNRAALESGADEYLTKPFAPEELRASAARLLGDSPEELQALSWLRERREGL